MQSYSAVTQYDSFHVVCMYVCVLVGDLNKETILAEEEDAHTKGLVIHLFMLN